MDKVFRETKTKIVFRRFRDPKFPAHIHDDIELIYTRKGGGTAFCDGKKYTLTEGSYFLVFPNQVHHYAQFQQGEYFLVILKPFELLRFQEIFLKGVPEQAVCCPGETTATQLLMLAWEEYSREGYTDVVAACLTAVFGKLLPHYPIKKADVPRDNVLKILQYCASHYKEELTVESLAQQLGVSCSCVSHIFSDRISMSFSDYISSLRLREAEEILQNRNYSVTEVANLSGFPTIRTFNRAFLKKHGMSPSAYRKNLGRE